MPSGILRWEGSAPRTTSSDNYEPIAAELRNNPGKWAVLAEKPDTADGRREVNRLYNRVKNGYSGFRRVPVGPTGLLSAPSPKEKGLFQTCPSLATSAGMTSAWHPRSSAAESQKPWPERPGRGRSGRGRLRLNYQRQNSSRISLGRRGHHRPISR